MAVIRVLSRVKVRFTAITKVKNVKFIKQEFVLYPYMFKCVKRYNEIHSLEAERLSLRKLKANRKIFHIYLSLATLRCLQNFNSYIKNKAGYFRFYEFNMIS
jgi:hypothetical protein